MKRYYPLKGLYNTFSVTVTFFSSTKYLPTYRSFWGLGHRIIPKFGLLSMVFKYFPMVFTNFGRNPTVFTNIVCCIPYPNLTNNFVFSLTDAISEMKPYDCAGRCQAPDEFFSGSPWVALPSSKILNVKPGD